MDIIKSDKDNRKYKYVTLSNSFNILFVHDADIDISAASLSVSVGSQSDPEMYLGLAHFLEHMLFMGTKKYPDENFYSQFISKHGGGMNAYTSNDHTNYFFSILSDHFMEAIDIFGHFFIDPLLKKDSINREVKAVHSEHEKNLSLDSRRIYQVLKELSDTKHPFSKFGTGNLDTLQKDDIHGQLVKFYEQYYSSNIMQLVLVHNASIDDMEQHIIDIFSQVPNRNTKIEDIIEYPYNMKLNGPYRVTIEPILDIHTLNIIWQLPSQRKNYKNGIMRYLTTFLNSEHEGSLYDILDARGFIFALTASTYIDDDFAELYSITTTLTDEGFKNENEVIQVIFEYMETLQKISISEKLYNEYKKVSNIQFRMDINNEPEGYVMNLASNALLYEPQHIICGEYLFLEYDQTTSGLFNDVIKHFNRNNVIVVSISKQHDVSEGTTEKWYGTKYKVVNKSQITKKADNETSINIVIPPDNIFIPAQFDMIKSEKQYPIPVIHPCNSKIFLRQDISYNLPVVYCSIILHRDVYSPLDNMLSTLSIELIAEKITKLFIQPLILYPGCISVTKHVDYDMVHFVYYSDKIIDLIRYFFEELKKLNVNDKDYHKTIDLANKIYKNNKMFPARKLASLILNSYYLHGRNIIDEQIELIGNITFDGLKKSFTNLLARADDIIVLSEGNITTQQADDICKIIAGNLESVQIKSSHEFHPPDKNMEIFMDAYNPNETNSGIIMSFFIGGLDLSVLDNIKIKIMLELTQLIISEPFYDTLRTKKQLGYVVHSKTKAVGGPQNNDYNMHNFIIQSHLHHANTLAKYIRKFLLKFFEHLKQLAHDEFDNYKSSLKKLLNKKFNDIFDHFLYDLFTITSRKMNFNFRDQGTKIIDDLKLDDIIKFYDDHYINNKSVCFIIGINRNIVTDEEADTDDDMIDSE
jgi:insulysin